MNILFKERSFWFIGGVLTESLIHSTSLYQVLGAVAYSTVAVFVSECIIHIIENKRK